MDRREAKGVAAALLSSCFGGSAVVATRAIVAESDPLTLALLRYAIGAAVLAVIVTLRRGWAIERRDILPVGLLGALFFALFPALFNASLLYTTAARGSLALSTLPLLTLAFAALVGAERPTWGKLLGVALAILGVRTALGPGLASGDLWIGDLLMMATAATGAVFNVLARPYLRRYAALPFTTCAMLGGLVALLPAVLLTPPGPRLPGPTFGTWMLVVYLGVVCAALVFFLWAYALERTTPTRVAVSVTANPVTSMLLAAWLLAEPMTPALLTGLAAVAGAIALPPAGVGGTIACYGYRGRLRMDIGNSVAAHYTRGGLGQAILDALAATGKDPERLTREDLAAVDEFHIRGVEATRELAQALELAPGRRVLDVGSGIGGPARHLAGEFGCSVTGIDLTPDYVEVARMLTERTGLSHLVKYVQGDALSMPFEDAGFDVVVTQHAAMNIAAKPDLYGEVLRVLEPGGLFGVYDILQGPGGEVRYPTPWSRDGTASFLVTPDELRALLEEAGFAILSWRESRDEGLAFFERVIERAKAGAPPVGLHLLFGPIFKEMALNMRDNLAGSRILPTQVICRRRG
jgi:drug/metabolite transporter (DMT)-like permease/SAM-dependent methyltransferase